MKAFENWKVRCADRDAATYHAELQRRLDRQSEAHREAVGLFDASATQWMGSTEVSKGAGEDLTTVKSALTKIRNHLQVPMSEVYIVAICNWSSPSLVSSASQKTQSAFLGALANDETTGPRTLGCVLEPVHSYQKGQLWKQEELLHKLLVNNRCNIDSRFVLPLAEQADERDQRRHVKHLLIELTLNKIQL